MRSWQTENAASSSTSTSSTWMNPALLKEFTVEDWCDESKEDLTDHSLLQEKTTMSLRVHQQNILKHALLLEKTSMVRVSDTLTFETKVGIIGDKVGAGKSFVILSLALHPMHGTNKRRIISMGHGLVSVFQNDANTVTSSKTNLLVIPHNLYQQWCDYITIYYKQPSRVLIIHRNKIMDSLDNNSIQIQNYDLVVVTNTMYNRLVHIANNRNLKWSRVIFDEVDNTHFPSCPETKADFYWFVTASFGNLIYPHGFRQMDTARRHHVYRAKGLSHNGFVKNIFVGLKDDKRVSYGLVLKNQDSFVDSALLLPEPNVRQIVCRTPMSIHVLQGLVSQGVIDSLNAGDIDHAIQQTCIDQRKPEDTIITTILKKWEHQLESHPVNTPFYNELKRKIATVKTRISEANTCCICMNDIDRKTIAPCCSNAYCFKCIHIWLSNSSVCPLCKAEIVAPDLFIVDNANHRDQSEGKINENMNVIIDPYSNTSPSNDKTENLYALLKRRLEDPNAKILIFSSYERTFVNMHTVMMRLGIEPMYLKGNMYCIRNVLEKYRSGEQRVLFVNVQHYGSGLNLEMTSDIIMFHKFNSEMEKQIIGRAQRPGRSSALNVWYLMHENELANTEQ